MLLAEGEQTLPNEQKVVRAEAIAMLAQMFTPEDWQAMANAASQTMAKDILQMGQEAAVPTLTV
jgi:single-stranded DNA-binding protein